MERKLFKYKTIEFWPENGRVMVLDTAKIDTAPVFSAIRSVRPKEFMKRALAVLALHSDDLPSERQEALRLVEHAEIVVRAALDKGDISDPEVFDWHVRNSFRKSSIVVPDASLVVPQGARPRATLKREPATKILVDGYTLEENANDTQGQTNTAERAS
jgi:hypothetical protein